MKSMGSDGSLSLPGMKVHHGRDCALFSVRNYHKITIALLLVVLL